MRLKFRLNSEHLKVAGLELKGRSKAQNLR